MKRRIDWFKKFALLFLAATLIFTAMPVCVMAEEVPEIPVTLDVGAEQAAEAVEAQALEMDAVEAAQVVEQQPSIEATANGGKFTQVIDDGKGNKILLQCEIVSESLETAKINGAIVQAGDSFSIPAELTPDSATAAAAYTLVFATFSGGGISELFFEENPALEGVDISGAANLEVLILYGSGISRIDLSENELLTEANLQNNPALTSLDVSKNGALAILGIDDCSGITAIDVTNNSELELLSIANTGISAIDVSRNHELSRLGIIGCSISNLDISGNPYIDVLMADGTQLRTLDMSANEMVDDVVITADNCTRLEYVVLPPKIAEFTGISFKDCPKLSIVRLPDSLPEFPERTDLFEGTGPLTLLVDGDYSDAAVYDDAIAQGYFPAGSGFPYVKAAKADLNPGETLSLGIGPASDLTAFGGDYSWLLNNKDILSGKNAYEKANASVADAGKYSCALSLGGVSYKTGTCNVTVGTPEPPVKVTNLKAELPIGNSITDTVDINWDAIPNTTGYNVYKEGRLVAKVADNKYRFGGLKAGTPLKEIQVSAYRGGVEGEKSVVLNTASRPAAPTGLKYVDKAKNSVALKWDAAPNVNYYRVYMKQALSGNDPWRGELKHIATVKHAAQYEAAGLKAGTKYKFEVVPVIRIGEASIRGTASNVIKAYTPKN